jgi:hypothetical protein
VVEALEDLEFDGVAHMGDECTLPGAMWAIMAPSVSV